MPTYNLRHVNIIALKLLTLLHRGGLGTIVKYLPYYPWWPGPVSIETGETAATVADTFLDLYHKRCRLGLNESQCSKRQSNKWA